MKNETPIKEKDFYCRQRKCKNHHGFGKNGNVKCSLANPELRELAGVTICNSYD